MDYQILLEADFLMNAHESSFAEAAIRQMHDLLSRTATGMHLLESMYLR